MRTLNLIPIEKLKKEVGKLRVWNVDKNKRGTLVEVFPPDREDYILAVDWNCGAKSRFWHFWGDKLEVCEEDDDGDM